MSRDLTEWSISCDQMPIDAECSGASSSWDRTLPQLPKTHEDSRYKVRLVNDHSRIRISTRLDRLTISM
jgi:hypothetical protein